MSERKEEKMDITIFANNEVQADKEIVKMKSAIWKDAVKNFANAQSLQEKSFIVERAIIHGIVPDHIENSSAKVYAKMEEMAVSEPKIVRRHNIVMPSMERQNG